MSDSTRRAFLQCSGALLGGIALGTQVTAAESADRYIVETNGGAVPSDLEVVHEMSGVDFAVVRGSEDDVESSNQVTDYEVDVEVKLEEPDTPDKLADREDVYDLPASRNGDDLYDLEWDKQDQDVRTIHDEKGVRGEGARVAVIDDGVYAGHPDLEVNEALSVNVTGDGNGTGALFDDHGTHVAGTIAAQDNGTGIVGTAPGAEIVDLRVFSGPFASFGDIVAAIVYSVAVDADAANLSLGAYPVPRQGLGSFYGKLLNRVMTFANREGTLLVVAAGNDSADLQHDKNFISLPNEGAQGLSVAATGPEGFDIPPEGFEDPPESPAYYTNFGTNAIDLGAPGGDLDLEALAEFAASDSELTVGERRTLVADWVLSTTFETPADEEPADEDGDGNIDDPPSSRTPRYGYKQGTSMATPQVAGAAALVRSADDSLNANQVESILENAASVPDDYDKTYYGSGYLDTLGAVESALEKAENGNGKGNGNGNGNGNSNGNGNN